jgi:hypothetical protein
LTVIKFSDKLPTPQQLELPRLRLAGLAHELTIDLAQCQEALMNSESAATLAAAIRRTADKLAEASAGWASISSTIPETWGI